MVGNEVYVEDLNSTNGTYVNGKAVEKQLLHHSDTVEIGKYKISYVSETRSSGTDKAQVVSAGNSDTAPLLAASIAVSGTIRVMSGSAAGREVALVKVVTTIGKPGVAVAAITKRPEGFVVAHVEGGEKPTLNGSPIGSEPVPLNNGDLLELAGTQMQFVQQ